MFRHNITDAGSQYENCNNLNSHNFYKCLAMSHSKNAAYTTPTRSTIGRYSLADTWHTPSPIQQKGIQSEVHVSTKIDSDSPGYSTRVVHYNEEQGKPLPTHSKYDKLGVFPIVHFFKKELPFLKRKILKVHSSNHSADISKFNTPAHNRLLLEKIIKSSPGNQETVSDNNESNTKSVLDALKEISGKRIHTDEEEFILKEDGKRIFVDYDDENNLSKRVKQNSQIEDSTPVTSPIRTAGLLNELMASCSSTDEYQNIESKKPRLNGHPNTTLKSFTPAKYVDVETQTSESHIPIISEPIDDFEKASEEDVNLNKTRREARIKKVSPINIFDETPLEIMRKNRLTALMGSLTANKEQNKIELSGLQSEDKSVLDKPLVSILAGSTKNLHKSAKHVTFDIPEVVNSTDGRNSTKSLLTSKDFSNIRTETDITKTSTSISSPIVSASITESLSPQKLSGSPTNDLFSLPKSSGTLVDQNKKNTSSEVHFRAPLPSSQVIQSKNLVFGTNTVDTDMNEKNNVNVNNEDVEINLSKAKVHGTEFPDVSQSAGFKFELKETTSTTTPTTTALFTFTTPTTYSNAKSTVSSNQENSNLLNDTRIINQSFGIPSVGPFSINRHQTSNTSSGVDVSPLASDTFGQSATTSHASSTFTTNFNMKTSTPNFNTCSTSTSRPTSFSFGSNSQSTTTTASNFTSSSFGSRNSSLKLFDNIKNPLNFSVATTPISLSFNVQTGACSTTSPLSSSSKGFITSNSSTVFPESTRKASSMNNFFFTGSDNSFTKKSFKNENNTPTNFGNSKAMFGQVPTTLFGTTAPSSFGSNTVSANVFENVKTTTTGMFTTTNGFATSPNLPAFGANTNSNVAPSNFGTNEKSNFGGNLNNDFKHNTSSSFGSPFNNGFGSNTNTCEFATNVSAASGASTSFDSNKGFAQKTSITSISSFGTSLPVEKSIEANTTETTPFDNTNLTFGSNTFGANPQNSQNKIFNFGNKPAVFSFGTNESLKSPFNLKKTETNVNIFGNKNLNDNGSSAFNSSTNSQFNLQQTGGNMFNIGVGTSTPNRLRAQHKTKRRT